MKPASRRWGKPSEGARQALVLAALLTIVGVVVAPALGVNGALGPFQTPVDLAPSAQRGRRRKKVGAPTDEQRESVLGYQRTDSQALNLAPVDPKYHKAVRGILADPRAHVGQLTMVADLDQVAAGYAPPKLDDCDEVDFLTAFRELIGQGKRLFVLLYLRVSTAGQARDGSSFEANLTLELQKMARFNLALAGIAIDVDGGDESDRPALKAAEQLIHDGIVRVMMVPALSRLDRHEVNFGARCQRYSERESWIYYGDGYGDRRLRYVVWSDIGTREKAVSRVRANEQYLEDGRDGVAAVNQLKLDDGYLVAANKAANFTLYEVAIEDPERPAARRKLQPRPDAKAIFQETSIAILRAWESKDDSFLERMAADESRRLGRSIRPKDIWWEYTIGWVYGINRISPLPETTPLQGECPDLALDDDRDRARSVAAAVDQLYDLRRVRRLKSTVAADDLDDVTKAQLAEVQAARGDTIRMATICTTCTPPTVRSVGQVKDGSAVHGSDYVICGDCGQRSSGNPGKIRFPRQEDFARADALPREPCYICGRFLPLKFALEVRVGALTYHIYSCSSCHEGGSKKIVDVRPRGERTKAKQTLLTSELAKLRQWKAEFADKVIPEEGLEKNDAALIKRLGGRRRRLWPGPCPPPIKDLRPNSVVNHLLPLLVAEGRGMEYYFTTSQLRECVLGPRVPGANDKARAKPLSRGQYQLRKMLRREGFLLKTIREEGTYDHLYWLEPAPARRSRSGGKNRHGDSASSSVASSPSP